ncbi:MAG: hydroxyacylglutathione hydrolase [Parvularculaceae bacterium]
MAIDVRQFPCLTDNYGFLVHDPATGATASVDTPDPAAIDAALDDAGWRLTHILNTHWHPDHVGGNLALKEKWGCEIVGPVGAAERIPGLDRPVGEGAEVDLGAARAQVLDAPGHTSGHIVYWFKADKTAFVGDVIFALGCGRLFEGTPAQMWTSIGKIAAMPPETRLYCAHEYTQANARFAVSVEPETDALIARAREIDAARARGEPTVPTTVAAEIATSPFLRADDPALKAALGMPDAAAAVDVFAEVRSRKDRF